ncbi:MAG: hypothetical protein ACK5WL_22295, partial [Pseudanabaena sp.]
MLNAFRHQRFDTVPTYSDIRDYHRAQRLSASEIRHQGLKALCRGQELVLNAFRHQRFDTHRRQRWTD